MIARAVPLMLAAAATIACAPATVRSRGQSTGAASPRLAVEQFLRAVHASDIQAMSVTWGTSRGPTRDTMERSELERRAIILQCYLAHDQYRIVGETPGEGGRRVFRVSLIRGQFTRQPTMYAVAGPGARWYVENVDLAAVRDFCGNPPPNAPTAPRP